MANVPVAGTSVASDLDLSLRDAKLSIPPPRAGLVSRQALIGDARASGSRIVGVTAPAGYGKSSLLAEWAASEERPVAWVSLDRFDDDPAALLSVLANAYTRMWPGDAELVADMSGLGLSVLGRAAPRLAAAVAACPSPFVLMLDDLHQLESPVCHDVLGVVMSGVPRGSQLVTASRSEQPHLPRLRAEGDVFELGMGDLALDAEGARFIFSLQQVALPPESAAEVTEHTEGWPVGIYLAALIAKESPAEGIALSGDDRYVADYLYKEALEHHSEEVTRFLRRSAVLDQLSGSLCDAVLGQVNSDAVLRRLEATSTFLVPLDRQRRWYRYHALFREFLLGELRRTEPELVMKLHLAAADWYEANGSPALALEHLLCTAERDRCVQLVTALILPTYSEGQMSTDERWLATLGTDSIEAYPPLAVLAGWIAVLTGHSADAERWAALVETATFDLVPADGSASFDSARAMLRAVMCASGPEQMMADARFAVSEEPAWSPWRDTALTALAEALLLAGDAEQANVWFAEAIAVGTTQGNTDTVVVGHAELALLAMDRGDWDEAVDHLHVALDVIDKNRMDDYAVAPLAFAGAARLALHRGDVKETNRQLARAMRARTACTYVLPWLTVRLQLQMAKVYVALSDVAAARHLLREIDDVLLHCPDLGTLVDEVSEFRQLVSSTLPTGAAGGPPLTPAELRLLPYLQTHLTFPEIAGRLYVSHNTVRSQVGSIYRKLGVSARSDAVRYATAIGLLGG